MSAHWQIGMQVECINDAFKGVESETLPRLGGIYTIRSIHAGTRSPAVFLRLTEIVNPAYDYWDGCEECKFAAEAFRPVQKRATDISIFTALLNPSEDDIAEIELVDSVYDILDYEYLIERPFQ